MTKYARGVAFERAVKADLTKHGWLVVRSAGSKGLLDLVGFCPWMVAIGVQCKISAKLSEVDRASLYRLGEAFLFNSILAYKDGVIKYSIITQDGYEDWDPAEWDI